MNVAISRRRTRTQGRSPVPIQDERKLHRGRTTRPAPDRTVFRPTIPLELASIALARSPTKSRNSIMLTLGHLRRRATFRRSGFSLVELAITMTIMAILVGVVSLKATGATDKARSTKIIETVENLMKPVMLYHQDTGQLPTEYSGWQGSSYHRLSTDPGVEGWNGPYISDPIRRSWNPTGGSVHVFNYVVAGYTNENGIDLDGDGHADVTGTNGSIMTFWDVDEKVAAKVNAAFDKGLSGDWHDAGRVEYQALERRLTCLLYHH